VRWSVRAARGWRDRAPPDRDERTCRGTITEPIGRGWTPAKTRLDWPIALVSPTLLPTGDHDGRNRCSRSRNPCSGSPESMFTIPESAFTIGRNRCSGCSGIRIQGGEHEPGIAVVADGCRPGRAARTAVGQAPDETDEKRREGPPWSLSMARSAPRYRIPAHGRASAASPSAPREAPGRRSNFLRFAEVIAQRHKATVCGKRDRQNQDGRG
jgi:hypothetical protein